MLKNTIGLFSTAAAAAAATQSDNRHKIFKGVGGIKNKNSPCTVYERALF